MAPQFLAYASRLIGLSTVDGLPRLPWHFGAAWVPRGARAEVVERNMVTGRVVQARIHASPGPITDSTNSAIQPMRWIAAVLLSAICVAALTGCVAGAATDPAAYVSQAQRYPEFLASSVRKVSTPVPTGSPRLERARLLSLFPETVVVRQEKGFRQYSRVGDSSISFLEQDISVKRGDVEVLRVQIPKVFYYSDLQVAWHSVRGERLAILVAYSRQTTSMVWLGLYDSNWRPLYRAVMPLHKVWSLQPQADGVSINGSAYAEHIQLPTALASPQ